MALRANGRAEFRPTEMPTNAVCHLESRRPPAFELSANGHLRGGDQISPSAGDNRSSAYSVPQPKKLLPLCVRYGCFGGGRMECLWSKNSICDWQAGARRTRLRDDPEGRRASTESAIAARSLFETTEMYPGTERWPPGYSGGMPGPFSRDAGSAAAQPGSLPRWIGGHPSCHETAFREIGRMR